MDFFICSRKISSFLTKLCHTAQHLFWEKPRNVMMKIHHSGLSYYIQTPDLPIQEYFLGKPCDWKTPFRAPAHYARYGVRCRVDRNISTKAQNLSIFTK